MKHSYYPRDVWEEAEDVLSVERDRAPILSDDPDREGREALQWLASHGIREATDNEGWVNP
jgi:hypothetical protein